MEVAVFLFLSLSEGYSQGTVVYRDLGSFWLQGTVDFVNQFRLDFRRVFESMTSGGE